MSALNAFVIASRTTRCASTSTAKRLASVCRPSSSSCLIPRPRITTTQNTPSNSRAFTSSSTSANTSSPSQNTTEEETPLQPELPNLVFPDPHRPDLFYHLVPPPTPLSRSQPAYALSFLGKEVDLYSGLGAAAGESPAVIGWLPAAQEGGGGSETTLSDFVHNNNFIRFMHDTIKSVLENGEDVVWTDGAMQLQQGWMHIHDQRNVPALGRIGDPDDIIGSVLVEDSKIKPGTYQPMPSYRVCTADGIVQLTEGVAKRLKERLLVEVGQGNIRT